MYAKLARYADTKLQQEVIVVSVVSGSQIVFRIKIHKTKPARPEQTDGQADREKDGRTVGRQRRSANE